MSSGQQDRVEMDRKEIQRLSVDNKRITQQRNELIAAFSDEIDRCVEETEDTSRECSNVGI